VVFFKFGFSGAPGANDIRSGDGAGCLFLFFDVNELLRCGMRPALRFCRGGCRNALVSPGEMRGDEKVARRNVPVDLL